MKTWFFSILFLTIYPVSGQSQKVEFNEVVPKYIAALWENKGAADESEFNVPELNQIKFFLSELSKSQNNIVSPLFLTKPTDNTLVAHYLNTKLRWNSFNGPHDGTVKLSTIEVIEKSIENLPERNELLAFYYNSVFIDVLNKRKPMDLAEVNIDLDNLNLDNDTEKAILFLAAMRHVGSQVTSYAATRFPVNCFRAIEYVENMPNFNGKSFYDFELPEFEDFIIEVDKRFPKMSFKERYIPEFENAKLGIEKCWENEKK